MDELSGFTQGQKQQIFQLMEVIGCQIKEACDLFMRGDMNFQMALAYRFGEQTAPSPSLPQKENIKTTWNALSKSRNEQIKEEKNQPNQISFQQFSALRGRYKTTQKPAINFKKTYLIKKEKKPAVPKGKKGKKQDPIEIQQELPFTVRLSGLLQRDNHLKISSSLYNALEQIFKTKRILALHCINIKNIKINESSQKTGLSGNLISQIYDRKEFVNLFNANFVNFGIDTSTYEVEESLKPFIDVKQDEDKILFFRINVQTNELQVFKKVKFVDVIRLESPAFLYDQLSEIGRQDKRIRKDQAMQKKMMSSYNMQTQQRAYQEYMEKAEEKRKIEEDRKIKMEQDRIFKQSYATQQKSQKIEQNKEQEIIKQSTIYQKRKLLRESLPKYDEEVFKDCITIKLRLPNGNSLTTSMPQYQKILYLFNYIESHQAEDLGFDNEKQRKFDILRPYDRLSLQNQKQKQFKEVFEGSEMQNLAVKEI